MRGWDRGLSAKLSHTLFGRTPSSPRFMPQDWQHMKARAIAWASDMKLCFRQLLQRMQQAQRRALQEVWERRMPGLPVKTPEQLVILASMIEKESGLADERTR